MSQKFISSKELAHRWGMNENSLRIQRLQGRGPRYLKLGRIIRYDIATIEEYESVRQQNSTAENSASGNASNMIPATGIFD